MTDDTSITGRKRRKPAKVSTGIITAKPQDLRMNMVVQAKPTSRWKSKI